MQSLLQDRLALALWLQRRQRKRRNAPRRSDVPAQPVIASVSTVDEALGGLVARLTWSWDPQGWDDTFNEATSVGGWFEISYSVPETGDASSWTVACPARASENAGFYPVEPAEFIFCITYRHRSAEGIVIASPASVGVTTRFDG